MIAIDPSLIALRQIRFRGEESGRRLAARSPLHYTPQTGKTSCDVVSGGSPALSSAGSCLLGRSHAGRLCQNRAKPGRRAASQQYWARLDAEPSRTACIYNPVLYAHGSYPRFVPIADCPRRSPGDASHSPPPIVGLTRSLCGLALCRAARRYLTGKRTRSINIRIKINH